MKIFCTLMILAGATVNTFFFVTSFIALQKDNMLAFMFLGFFAVYMAWRFPSFIDTVISDYKSYKCEQKEKHSDID